MSKLQHCTYVLYSLKDHQLYVGSTSNLKQRLTDHFHGHNKSTAPRRPFKLIFCEFFLSKKDALRRERYFKTTIGKRQLKLILRETLAYMSSFTDVENNDQLAHAAKSTHHLEHP